MVDRLTGKVVAITGAGQGIGADVARRLVARGAEVALLDRVAETIEDLARELGAGAAAFVADVTDDAQVTDAINAASATSAA
ncbi:hypothetical protein GCM10023147_06160 [Tsukamurella soli]|uniref:Short chain dehydrogenase n=1 Tax=Tsukamurella soli TaxID=644556 RepID=A0ABP8J4N8_9ACTN